MLWALLLARHLPIGMAEAGTVLPVGWPQWMEHFRGRRRQRKLVERDLSRFVYCEDCDLYVENLEFETHKNGSMHLGNVIKAGRLTDRRR